MRQILTFIYLVISLTASAQVKNATPFDSHNWKAPYGLPVPKGWSVERFQLPITFAPDIPYRGVEDVRFAPGWSKASSDNYWTYGFLWFLDGDIKISTNDLEKNLTLYYTGLIQANGPNIPPEKLIAVVTDLENGIVEKKDKEAYVGTIKIVDYMTEKPMVLNCKVHVSKCAGQDKTFVFFQLSPRPLTDIVWKGLDKLWTDFKCTPGK